jgi:uncharacterized tellurite resistance protein B-like protein
MLKRLVEQISSAITAPESRQPDPAEREHAIRMETAVLMADVARADNEFDETEMNLLLELVARHFELSPDEACELANAADEEAGRMVSLHRFTQLLHQNLSEDEKAHVVSLLWQVAYADGRLSKYEDSLVLKISDLLYVKRGRVMRLKHDAEKSASD